MNCTTCGRTNRADSRFCVGCGTAIVARCTACGREAESDARFCGGCGSPLAAPPPAPSAPAASSAPHPAARGSDAAVARKIVTIVFADLAGSTGLHERLDAESARALMDRYYRTLHAVVDAHGGTVVKLLGDGVMVAFGVPRVAEDDAIRAVRAAVGMQEAFRTLAGEQAAALGAMGLRVAVNTGEVVVSGAHDDVVGDPVNVAARLQQEARDGDVLIGEATRRLVSDLVTLEPVGTIALKGRAETVAAHRVVSLERPAGAATLAFVGRDDELRRLTAVYDAAVAARAARLAVVLGSPGLGKSRLVGELVRRIGDGTIVVSAHCDATGGATFAPLANGLRALLQLDAAAGGDTVRAALEERMGSEAPDRGRVATGVAALLAGTPAAPEETFFVVRRFLAALAAAQPVVLVIDDLQWAEPLLLDLVEHLVQWGTDAPLLLLVAARPELRDARSSLAVPGGVVSDVATLAGLDAGAATRLAANAIGADELPAAVAGRVLAISEGNPLFVGELVRMLVQDGALKREGERWTTAVDLSTLAMPPTIHALLAARIERLRPEERIVLERAAVVGRQFSRAAIAHLLPREVTDLDARLEALRRSELIESAGGWFLGEPALTFHHGLIRDAAYRRILKGTRAELHERFADWLASRAGTGIDHDETMGWHLEQAHQHLGELGPLDAHGRAIGERAARHLAAAGRRALERDDLPLAGGLLGRAVERLDGADPARADLALDWCEALLTAGDVGPAATAVAELARFTPGAERLRGWHICFAGQLAALTDPATLRSTADAVATAATTLAALDDAAGEAKAHAVQATALARLGEIGACEAALDRALAAARRAGDRRRANAVLAGAPVAALWGPSPVTRASGRCLDVVRVLRITQGAPAVEAVALRCQAVLEALRGRAEAARRMIAASRKLVEELGITQRLLEAEVSTGLIELLEGDAAAAERALHPAYDGLRRQGLGIDAAQAAALLGRALLAQGRAAEAEALSHESELLAGDDLKAAIAWRGVRAEALARRGEHGEAIAFARAAVAIAAATDALLDHADARLALAAALRAAGKHAEADAEEARAIGLWEAKGAVLLAERARGAGTLLDPAAHTSDERSESPPPVRRPVRENAATANIARVGAALDARNADEFRTLLADDYVGVHHATGLTYDRTAAVARLHALLRSEDLVIAHDPVATLGDTLALFRWSMSSSGGAGETFDVGAWEHESFDLIEVDGRERRRRFEQFADDHLGDAVARLYQRHAELLPEGPARTRAMATARTVAAHMAPFDFERLATTFAADVAVVDHRTVGFGTLHGAERLRPALQAFLDLIDGFAWRAVDVLALEPDAFLFRYVGSGTERVGGVPYERTQLELMAFGADGLLARWERFDVEHAAAALARFDALVGNHHLEPTLRRVRPNAATAFRERMETAMVARDFDAMSALLANLRAAASHELGHTLDREAVLKVLRASAEQGEAPVLTHELLAVLGERLVLFRATIALAGYVAGELAFGAASSTHTYLFEVDEHGMATFVELFAGTRLGDGVSRLYARYAELLPGGPARTRAAATARAVAAMVAPPELERYASALAPDVVFVDHRTVGFAGGRGADALLRGFRSLFELADQLTTRVEDVLRLEPDAVLLRWTVTGIDRASGGAFESEFLLLWVFGPDGRVVRDETFDANRTAEAAARFDALMGGTGSASTVDFGATAFANAATESTRRIGELWEARDWTGLLHALPPEFRYVDRRSMAQLELDRHGYVEFIRQLGDMRSVSVAGEVLATRGEHLALGRLRVEVAGGDVGPSEVEFLDVIETNERGETILRVRFDAADLDAAYAELDARFEAGEGARHGAAMAANRARLEAFARRDWEALTSVFAPSFAVDDHRLLGWGTTLTDRTTYVRSQQATVELAPDSRVRVEHLRTSDGGFFVGVVVHGMRDGGTFETPLLLVAEVDRAGLILRYDVYDVGDYERARARFAALGARDPSMPPPCFANAATRAWGQAAVQYQARERSTSLFSERFRYTDRRRIAHLDLDREGFGELTRQFENMRSVELHHEVLATRGEHLALVRIHLEVEDADVGPSEIFNLNVIETDEQGQFVTWVRFDPDDLEAAYAELDARFEAGEGARYGAATTANRAMREAATRRDWEALTATLASTFNANDHRLLGWGTTLADPATFVRSQQALAELSPDVQVRIEHLRFSDVGSFAHAVMHGTRDGGAFETPLLLVAEVDGAGLTLRWDAYDVDDYERARARFDALTTKATPAVPTRFAPKPNAATAAMERMWLAFDVRDLGAARALCTTDVQWHDRRPLVRISGDAELMAASLRERLATGARLEARVVIGTAGDRIALARVLWAGGPPEGRFEMEFLALHEVDEAGLVTALVFFDVADELVARREARDRWLAIDPVAAAVVGWQARFHDAWNDGDRARVRGTLADDLVVHDHRRTGVGRIDDVEIYVDSIVTLWELAPDARIECWSWLAVEPHGCVCVVRRAGQLPDGGAFESEFLGLHTVTHGRCTRLETFELDAVDAALARLAELRPDPLRIPPNAATRANDRYLAYCRARDWEALRAHYHPAGVFENRRRLLRTSGGVEMGIANARHLWEPGVDAERTVLATAGDRLALERWRFTGREDDVLLWERESLIVLEVDAEGRTVAVIIFDLEDRAAASDELVERSARIAFPPALADRLVEMNRARRARDIPRLRATFPDDFYFDDHRRTGFGRLEGPDAYMAAVAALYEQSPDVTVGEPLYTLEEASHGSLAVGRTFGTLNDGGAFESVFLQMALYDADGFVGAELFELEDLERARARFAELRPDPRRLPRTAATHAIARSVKAFRAGDWEAVPALVRDDFVFEDRSKRALVRGDVETWLGSMQFTKELPQIRIDGEIIATLGERIALQSMVVEGGPEGGEFELLHRIRLFVVDAEGKLGAVILFDLDDRKLAFVEALDRFVAGEAAATGGLAPYADFCRAYSAYDWEAVRRTLAPDFVLDDRRANGLGRLDREQWIASLEAQAALVPDLAGEARRVLAWNRHGLVVELCTHRLVDGGGPFENVFLCVVRTSGDRVRTSIAFDLTDTDCALACFAELSNEP